MDRFGVVLRVYVYACVYECVCVCMSMYEIHCMRMRMYVQFVCGGRYLEDVLSILY